MSSQLCAVISPPSCGTFTETTTPVLPLRGVLPLCARFTAPLASEALAYLLDHRVAGRSLLPGAAMFEAVAAAGRTLAGAAADGHAAAALAGADLCLVRVAIPAPVLLTAGGGGALECAVDCRAGAVQLAQAPAGGGGASAADPLSELHACGVCLGRSAILCTVVRTSLLKGLDMCHAQAASPA